MGEERRPDPQAILSAIQEETKKKTKLRLFLGMAAGVGKTYSMLRATHKKREEGVSVLVGVVETHQRTETQKLLEGLPLLPKKKIEYRGTIQEEMDLEEILRRKPSLVIIDELAHTNIPGSRHKKRYQDVLEILDAGIDVYTALNVQHLESRKDSVESITGITIHETVPDSILERASLVELVDIAPTELIQRIQEGKVYKGNQVERAKNNFFKEDQLTALREISLRITAEKVDQDLQKLAQSRPENKKNPWQTNERLLVSISEKSESEKLIRAARRLAYNLEAPWITLYINTGLALTQEEQLQLTKNLDLARELKAEVITLTDTDLLLALKQVCRQKNVTQLILGKSTQKPFWTFFLSLFKKPLLDKIIQHITEVDIHIIHQNKAALPSMNSLGGFLKKIFSVLFDPLQSIEGKQASSFKRIFLLIFGTTLLGFILKDWIHYATMGFFFILTVFWIGISGNFQNVILGSILSLLSWIFFFISPIWIFSIQHANDVILCITFFSVALMTGLITSRMQLHQILIRQREQQTRVLYEALKDITRSQEKSEFLFQINQRVGTLLKGKCGILLKSQNGEFKIQAEKTYNSLLTLAEKDQTVALWCYENLQPAGWSTDTLSQSRALFLPIQGPSEKIGVFLFEPDHPTVKLTLDQKNLLLTLGEQLGTALERHFLQKRLLAKS